MHPVIKEFQNTNTRLVKVLEKFREKGNFFEDTFFELAILNTSNEKPKQEFYSKLDQAIIKGHSDQNIYLLFLINYIRLAFVQQHPEKAKSIQSIAASLLQENIIPIIQALYMQMTGRLKNFELNNFECLRLMKEAIEKVDQNNPRFKNILSNYAGMLAAQGKLNDLEKFELECLNHPIDDIDAFARVEAHTINSIVIGNFQFGFSQMSEFRRLFPSYDIKRIQNYFDSLTLLSGDLNESHYQDESFKLIVQVLYNLSLGKIEEALKANKTFLKGVKSIYTNDLIFEYIPLQLELSMGNKDAAQKFLENKEAIGDKHYLDDIFYARIHLMEGDFDSAYTAMSRLLKNAEHYGAMNRVMFELQFAKEIKSSHLFLLMSKFKNAEIVAEPKIKNILPVEINRIGKQLLVGNSFLINQVKNQISKYAPLKEIILITGETGTGKELVARALHDESSLSSEPYLAINCGALTDTLLESELFGYEAGSFTGALKQKKGIFEAAGKGTVFLDEFGEISSKLQVSLLRVLESNEIRMIGGTKSRKIECRILIATNIELKGAVEAKKFREDLYFRLTRLEIQLPPLRERISDIPELVKYFLEGTKGILGKQKVVSDEVMKVFSSYQWPGNIRELKNCIDRLKILNPEKDSLEIEDLDFMQFQGIKAIPKNTEKLESIKSPSKEPEKNQNNEQSGDDPILKMIIQRGLKSEQRILHLKKLFEKYKILSRCQIMEITNINPITASKDLQKLCEQGFIIKRTPTKSRRSNYYELI